MPGRIIEQTLRILLAQQQERNNNPPASSTDQANREPARITWSGNQENLGSASPTRARRVPPAKKSNALKKLPPKVDQRVEWSGNTPGSQPDPASLLGVEDAFEHTLLQSGEQVAFCKYDGVAYHLTTWDFLRRENGGRCCSCGKSGTVITLTLPGVSQPVRQAPEYIPVWLDAGQEIIRLETVSGFIGRSAIVQDFVHEVYQTKSTGTYFVRFEPRSHNDRVFDGFKVVIRPRYEVNWIKAGISPRSYAGHTIRVQGLIQEHPDWGIEILVNSPRVIQILDIQDEG
jgi:hypothetical protein